MKKMLFTILLCVISNISFSQSQATEVIKKSFVINQTELNSNEFKKKSFLFSLTLKIDNDGNVDSVSHSQSDLFSSKLIDMKKIVRKLKSGKNSFKEYRDQVLFIGINLMHHDAERILLTDIDKLYTSLLESSEKNKKITYLNPLLIVI